MWYRIALVIGIYLAAVLETSVTEQPATLQIAWLILVASFAMWQLPAPEAAGWGAGIGFVCDALSGTPLGLHALLLSMAVWGAALCRDRWLGQSLASYGASTMAVTALVILAAAGVRWFQNESFGPMTHVSLVAAGAAAATGLCGLVGVIACRTVAYAAAANGLIPQKRATARSA